MATMEQAIGAYRTQQKLRPVTQAWSEANVLLANVKICSEVFRNGELRNQHGDEWAKGAAYAFGLCAERVETYLLPRAITLEKTIADLQLGGTGQR